MHNRHYRKHLKGMDFSAGGNNDIVFTEKRKREKKKRSADGDRNERESRNLTKLSKRRKFHVSSWDICGNLPRYRGE